MHRPMEWRTPSRFAIFPWNNSGLIHQIDYEMCYNYYYVNVERCLPIEKGVSKSVNIIGTNLSTKSIDLYVFCEYNCSIDINILLGVRV